MIAGYTGLAEPANAIGRTRLAAMGRLVAGIFSGRGALASVDWWLCAGSP